MSFFLITHPRSGSSNLANNFCRSFSLKNKIWNLDEIFHPGCRSSWGDFRNYSVDRSGVLFQLKTTIEFEQTTYTYSVSKVSEYLYQQVQKVSDVDCWYENEIENRIQLLDIIENKQQQYLVKLFVDHPRWFDFDYKNKQCLVLYRKDFFGSILSMLIKNNYQKKLQMHNGHIDRYKGGLISVPDFSFAVNYEHFHSRIQPFLNLLKFTKKHTDIARVSYEDLYEKEKKIIIFSHRMHLNDIEKKLEYAKAKSKYFVNFQSLSTWFSDMIVEEKLEEICGDLGVAYG